MIAELERINPKVLNIVLYMQNDAMQYYARTVLKHKFDCVGDFVLDAASAKELKQAVNRVWGQPDEGSAWMINVDTTKMSKADVLKAMHITPNYVVTVYWVTKYSLYKDIQNSDIAKRQGTYCYTNYFGRLTDKDVYRLLDKDFRDEHKKPLDKYLIDFVAKNYLWDVQAVFDLVSYVKSGNEFETTKDVIEAVGLGGNTVDSFTVNLLLSNVNTLKGKKTVIHKHLKTLNDLSLSYKLSSIKNFMMNTVDGFIDMKQLQIMGLYRRGHYKIPESFDSKRLMRLRRYEWAVLDKITLARLLLLKQCLLKVGVAYLDIGLIEVIIDFIDGLSDTTEEEKMAIQGIKPEVTRRKRKTGTLKKKVVRKVADSSNKDTEVKKSETVKKSEVVKNRGTYMGLLKDVLYNNTSMDDLENTIKNRKES